MLSMARSRGVAKDDLECGGKRSAMPLWITVSQGMPQRIVYAWHSGVAFRLPPHSTLRSSELSDKGENLNSWVAFLATATAALLYVTLPSIVAIYLPLANALNHLPAQ
jgi:hypothetical protein